jgi:cyclase
MCDVSRRNFLAVGAGAFLASAREEELLAGAQRLTRLPRGVHEVATDVFFYEADNAETGYCNSGWVIFDDYVLVIDANYPAGARELVAAIRTMTEKPIRFAFDTHHHGDHAYGNQVWHEHGATAVAHAGVLEEMKRYETGHFGGPPGRWESEAKARQDVRESRLKPPSLLFPDRLFFDDGRHRVELVHFGVGHTHGDAFAWLPRERILFSGDACVNGPYNYVGDGHVGQWIETLDEPKKLGARLVCPGHGSRGAAELLDDQQAFFRTLIEHVDRRLVPLPPEQARSAIEALRAEIEAMPRVGRYVAPTPSAGSGWDAFPGQVEKVYEELTGRALVGSWGAAQHARRLHARAHGHA